MNEEMTTAQMKWAKKLEKLLREMPDGIEIIVGGSSITFHPAGFYQKKVWEDGIDLMTEGDVIDNGSIHTFDFPRDRVYPNSESI